MKKLFFICVLSLSVGLLSSCGVSADDVTEETKELMIKEFKKEGNVLKFTDFHLIHESGNKYRGIASCTVDGESADFNVEVLCDGERIEAQWEYIGE